MMKKRIIKSLVVVALLLCTVLVLYACSGADIDMDGPGNEGGGDGAIDGITITFVDGEEIIHTSTDSQSVTSYVPAEKEGYTFEGWFLNEELTEVVAKLPTTSTTLYAKWAIKTFTVRFVHNDGSIIQVNGEDFQIIEYGKSAIAPEAPTLEGYEFIGWNIAFDSVKTNLIVRANFGTAKQSIIVYGEDGLLLKSERVEVGSDISIKYNTLLDEIEQSLPGGLAFDALCIDEELLVPYQIPSGEHLMPTTDLVLYVRAVIQEIDGLAITPSRNDYQYDLNGVTLVGSLYDNAIISYSYEWYDVTLNEIIAGENGTILEVPNKDVGEYIYEIRATATYKDYEPKHASARVTINVVPGSLQGMISVEGYTDTYNGLAREPVFTGLHAGDKVSYRIKDTETEFGANPVKDAGNYYVESLVERENYEPLELSAVNMVIKKAKLIVDVSIAAPIDENGYYLMYGSQGPKLKYEIIGFVNGETEAVLEGTRIEIAEYYVGAPVREEPYMYGIEEGCWQSKNYEFIEWRTIGLNVRKRPLSIAVESKTITYGDEKPSYSVIVTGALEQDAQLIPENVVYTCEYIKGTGTGVYDISATYSNDSYDVTIINSKLVVAPKAITVKPANLKVVYGAQIPTYTFSAEGLINGEKIGVLGTPVAVCDYAFGKGVGEYEISINKESLSNENYVITFAKGVLTVEPKPLTLSLADSTITYYDAVPSKEEFASKLSADGLIDGDTIENSLKTSAYAFTTLYAIGQPVDTYEVAIVGYSSPNYSITLNKGKLIVGKRPLTLSVVESSVQYGEELNIQVTPVGLVGEDVFDHEKAFSGGGITGGYVVGDGVGSYTVTVGNYQSTNYEITYVSGKITVLPREITIKARAYTDDEIVWSKSIATNDSSMVINGLFAQDTISGTLMTTSSEARGYLLKEGWEEFHNNEDFAFDSADPFLILRGNESVIANYNVRFDVQVAIKTYGMLVTADDVYYDGGQHGLNVQQMFEEPIGVLLYSEDGISYSESAIEYTVPGNYTLYYAYRVFNVAGEIEKDVPAKNPAMVVIKPRPINILVDDKTITYGDADPELTYSVTPYQEGEDIYAAGESLETLGTMVLSIVADSGSYEGNAGFYNIVADGLANANYQINIVTARLTVNPKDLTVTADSFEITYGDAFPTPTFKYEGFVKGESVESLNTQTLYSCLYSADANGYAGDFAITPILSLANYKITTVSGNLKVNKKAMTLTAKSLTATFGDETPQLSAVPSVLVYNDTVNTIGTIKMETAYERGSNVGTYVINLTATSNKYDLTLINGNITVNQKSVAVSWTGNDASYTYNGEDHSNAIGATYVDIYGATIDATVSFNASNSTPHMFKNAGSYATTATTTDGNYKLTNSSITLSIIKARYENIVYEASFTGVYSPEKHLGTDYGVSAEDGFRWKNPDEVPVVNKITYTICYNKDAENYFDYEIEIPIELSPAVVTFDVSSETILEEYEHETDYNTANGGLINPTIYWLEGKTAIGATGNYEISWSNGNSFIGGTHMTVMTFKSVNYKLVNSTLQTNNFENVTTVVHYLKYKTVKSSADNKFYTPEEAIDVATSGMLTVMTDTTFAYQQEVRSKYYSAIDYTIESGVTLLMPFNENDTRGYVPGAKKGKADYDTNTPNDTPVHLRASDTPYLTLTVPRGTTLTVKGTFIIGAQTGDKSGSNVPQNEISAFAKLVVEDGATITLESAKFNAYGYVVGGGTIYANGSSAIIETLYIVDWPGGSAAGGMYTGGQSLSILDLLGSEVKVKNPTMFPFKNYEINTNQVRTIYSYGSSLQGMAKIATNKLSVSIITIDEQTNVGYLGIIGSGSANSGLFRMLSEGATITKDYVNGKTVFTFDGSNADGYSSLNVKVATTSISLNTSYVSLPIPSNFDIIINSGTLTQSYKWQLESGANLSIKAGAEYVLNSTVVTCNGAKLTVDGTFTLNGSFGGDVYSNSAGAKVVVGANATISSVKAINGVGSRDGTTFTFTESGSVVRNLDLFNASGSTTQVSKGTTYTYDGTAWA